MTVNRTLTIGPLTLSLVVGSIVSASCSRTVVQVDVPGGTLPERVDDPAEGGVRVAHVCAESGLRAGTRVGGPMVLTVEDRDDVSMPFAIVDGEVMCWFHPLGQRAAPAKLLKREFPRSRTLAGGDATARGSRLADAGPLQAGTVVRIGGFFVPIATDPLAFLKIEPSFVSGCIVNPPQVDADRASRNGAFRLSVPKGDYAQFRGGPVCVETDHGPAVAGIVLGAAEGGISDDTERSYLLGMTIQGCRQWEAQLWSTGDD